MLNGVLVCLSGARSVELQFLGRRDAHVPGEPHRLQHADEAVGEVHFPGAKAVASGSREGVMVVMPAFSVGYKPPTSNWSKGPKHRNSGNRIYD